jgi:G3E family GTPase
MQTIDVYILTGFLGAGKTTALNALLGGELSSADPALIINEFGTLSVDGALVERRDLTRYEINKGSVFCICTKTDFLKALTEIAQKGQHSVVLIEATGIAETADIESFIEVEHLNEQFTIRANLCMVDAANFTQVAAYLKPAVTQVRYADAVILNKTDLVSGDELQRLRTLLGELNPRAVAIDTRYGRLPAGFLKTLVHRRYIETFAEQPPADIVAASIGSQEVFDRAKFYTAVTALKENLLRLKGHIRFPEGLRFVELAGTVFTETDPADGYPGDTAFTAIAWKIERQTLKEHLMNCIGAS